MGWTTRKMDMKMTNITITMSQLNRIRTMFGMEVMEEE